MDSFRLILLGAGILGAAAITLCSATSVQAKQCSAERPANTRSYWSYRLIDGRKCWYEGKRMISKSLLHWPSSKQAQAARPNVASAAQRGLLDAQASISDVAATKPNPDLKREMADLTIMDRWPEAELPRYQREAAAVETASSMVARALLMVTIVLMALGAVLIAVNVHRRALRVARH
jgi:hypothetical protein